MEPVNLPPASQAERRRRERAMSERQALIQAIKQLDPAINDQRLRLMTFPELAALFKKLRGY